jgi:AraC-like DNA-binding protein
MTAFVEKQLFREGILKPGPFTDSYDLRCYEPSDKLKPFVEHYFISRRRQGYNPSYEGNDVLSQPVVTLFFKPEGAYFEGPTTGKRTLTAKTSPIYVGAQFKPGGFYPFWKQRVSDLAEQHIPAASVLETVDDAFIKALLANSDNQQLVTKIDAQLRAVLPRIDPTVELLNKVIAYIEASGGATNVSAAAAEFGMSERMLQHLFQTYIGVGAKWAIMRTRFLEVIKHARQHDNPDWTTIAAEFGYTDQSHFINDFKKLVGEPPAKYMHI